MKKVELTVYPYAYFGSEGGKLRRDFNVGSNSYRILSENEPSFDKNYGTVTIPLPEVKVVIEVPDNFDDVLLATLEKYRKDLKAEHQRMLTQLQFTINQLKGLPAPDVLDAT